MPQTETSEVCPRGHLSQERDYCSECGTRMSEAIASTSPQVPDLPAFPPAAAETCPDCGTLRDQSGILFCEVCGFNYQTGARGEIPGLTGDLLSSATTESSAASAAEAGATVSEAEAKVREAEPSAPEPAPTPHRWQVLIEVDPSLREEGSPVPPSDFTPFTVFLDRSSTLLGRGDAARGIAPEIVLSHDDAISRRHALLLLDAASGQLSLRDIGASNGTRLNGHELTPMTDHGLQDGDQITLGHWTRLRIHHE